MRNNAGEDRAVTMFRYISFGTIELHKQIGPPTVEGLRGHVNAVTERMRSRLQVGRSPLVYTIQDNTGFAPAGAAERKVLGEWMAQEFELLHACSIGVGFVIDSAMVRGALTAVFWLSRLPSPYRVHPTLQEALRIAIEQVDGAGLAVNPQLRSGGAPLLAKGP